MSIKPCIRCGSIDRYKDGRCKCCVKNRNEAYRRLHGVPVKEPKKIKPPKIKKPLKIVDIVAYRLDYERKHKSRISARRAIYSAIHKDKIASVSALWRKENPEICSIHSHNRRALEKSISGNLSKGLFEKLFKLQKGKCACCKVKLSNTKPRSPMDHVISLARGGLNIDSNMQLLCQPCNNQKHAKDPIDFMQSKGFLL